MNLTDQRFQKTHTHTETEREREREREKHTDTRTDDTEGIPRRLRGWNKK